MNGQESKKTYSEKEIMQVLKDLLERYGDLEVFFYWKDEYVGSCKSKIDVRKAENGYEIKFYSAEC